MIPYMTVLLDMLLNVLAPSYSMLRNNASGPEIGLPGRMSAGLLPGKHRHGPSGRPKAGRRTDFSAFPVAVWPKPGPEIRFPARKHHLRNME